MQSPHWAYVFLCSDFTEDDCLRLNLFGGTQQYASKVKNLKVGDILYLYNFQSKRLHGIFCAESEVGTDLVKDIWEGDFPLQVKVRRVDEHTPISKVDFEHVVSFFNGKPQARLDQEKVEKLKNLFASPDRLPPEESDYRRENAATVPTHDGHWVRSWAEAKIDNWLYDNGIPHGYELRVGDGFCDFLVPTAKGEIYIEYWGMEDKAYKIRKERKIKSYEKLELTLLSVEPKDLECLDEKFELLKNSADKKG